MSNEQFKQVAMILIHGNDPLFKRDGSVPTVAELAAGLREAFAHVSDDTPERDAKILELERERDRLRLALQWILEFSQYDNQNSTAEVLVKVDKIQCTTVAALAGKELDR